MVAHRPSDLWAYPWVALRDGWQDGGDPLQSLASLRGGSRCGFGRSVDVDMDTCVEVFSTRNASRRGSSKRRCHCVGAPVKTRGRREGEVAVLGRRRSSEAGGCRVHILLPQCFGACTFSGVHCACIISVKRCTCFPFQCVTPAPAVNTGFSLPLPVVKECIYHGLRLTSEHRWCWLHHRSRLW